MALAGAMLHGVLGARCAATWKALEVPAAARATCMSWTVAGDVPNHMTIGIRWGQKELRILFDLVFFIAIVLIPLVSIIGIVYFILWLLLGFFS